MNSVHAVSREQSERRHEGEAYLLRQLARPEIVDKIAKARANSALVDSYLLCLTAFTFGVAFQTSDLTDDELKRRLIASEAVAAFTQWIRKGNHSGLTQVSLYPIVRRASDMVEYNPEPDHTDDFAVHELLAVFRAGARYAATGSPFRSPNAWSIPAADERHG